MLRSPSETDAGPVGASPPSSWLPPYPDDGPAARPSDSELVRKTLAGEGRAFARLVERYKGLLMLVAFRRTGRPSECEDIVQEAFVRAYRALPTLADPGRFKSWIAQIATNAALDRVRRRSPVVSFDQESGLIEALPPGRGAPPPARAEKEDERTRLIRAIEGLPEIYQAPVCLRYLEGLPYREIARRLGLREDALRKRIHRATEELRRVLLGSRTASEERGPGRAPSRGSEDA
jgi:RNA polymerase sigma-70 factor (ECF subfamily)